MDDSKIVCTPMVISFKLREKYESLKANQRKYRSMIGGFLYLIATRSDIMYVVCLVARFQYPKESHVATIKRIFRYLKGNPKFGSWYPRDIDLSLSEYIDVDLVGCTNDKISKRGGAFFLGRILVSWLSKMQY